MPILRLNPILGKKDPALQEFDLWVSSDPSFPLTVVPVLGAEWVVTRGWDRMGLYLGHSSLGFQTETPLFPVDPP